MLTLTEGNGLQAKTIEDLRELADICAQHDGFKPKIFWEALALKRSHPGDYCIYQGKKMVAYLSTFNFVEDEMEVSSLIHPDYRNTHLFMDIFNYAKAKFTFHQPDSYLFSCHKDALESEQLYQSLGAHLSHREYSLCRQKSGIEEFSPIKDFHLRTPTLKDVTLMARIDHECFDTPLNIMISRFKQIVPLKHRRHWLAYYNDTCVGKMHARFDADGVYFHDIAILPLHQGKGFGTQLLKHVINELCAEGHQLFYLTVDGLNDNALSLYANSGFEIENIFNFWRLDKADESSKILVKAKEELTH